MATYYFTKTVEMPLDQAVEHVTEALKQEGFGVLTEIDVQATLKKKLDVDFRPYRILGACNPQFAYQALQAEDKIGTMLPCNCLLVGGPLSAGRPQAPDHDQEKVQATQADSFHKRHWLALIDRPPPSGPS